MRNASKETGSFVTEQIMQARAILDGLLKHLSVDVRTTAKVSPKPRAQNLAMGIDFSTPLRAFIKKYSGGMSGAKKFTLVLAHLAKGNLDKEIKLTEIESSHWNGVSLLKLCSA